jgi:hypothetical protein
MDTAVLFHNAATARLGVIGQGEDQDFSNGFGRPEVNPLSRIFV